MATKNQNFGRKDINNISFSSDSEILEADELYMNKEPSQNKNYFTHIRDQEVRQNLEDLAQVTLSQRSLQKSPRSP